jgi:hypothetical protein
LDFVVDFRPGANLPVEQPQSIQISRLSTDRLRQKTLLLRAIIHSPRPISKNSIDADPTEIAVDPELHSEPLPDIRVMLHGPPLNAFDSPDSGMCIAFHVAPQTIRTGCKKPFTPRWTLGVPGPSNSTTGSRAGEVPLLKFSCLIISLRIMK